MDLRPFFFSVGLCVRLFQVGGVEDQNKGAQGLESVSYFNSEQNSMSLYNFCTSFYESSTIHNKKHTVSHNTAFSKANYVL